MFPIADLPEWARAKLTHPSVTQDRPHGHDRRTPSNSAQEAGDVGVHWLDKALAKFGAREYRNATGAWLAQQLRDAGLSESEAEPWMLTYAAQVRPAITLHRP